MEDLVQECISFVVCNLGDIVRLPIDMTCLNQGLIDRIALKTPLMHLNNLFDKRDKLQSKLFDCKLSQLLQINRIVWDSKPTDRTSHQCDDGEGFSPLFNDLIQRSRRCGYTNSIHESLFLTKTNDQIVSNSEEGNGVNTNVFSQELNVIDTEPQVESASGGVSHCQNCKQLFHPEVKQHCAKGVVEIDFHGRQAQSHVASPNFSLVSFVRHAQQSLVFGSRDLFWHVWSTLQSFECYACE
jgi:hypothetical protein